MLIDGTQMILYDYYKDVCKQIWPSDQTVLGLGAYGPQKYFIFPACYIELRAESALGGFHRWFGKHIPHCKRQEKNETFLWSIGPQSQNSLKPHYQICMHESLQHENNTGSSTINYDSTQALSTISYLPAAHGVDLLTKIYVSPQVQQLRQEEGRQPKDGKLGNTQLAWSGLSSCCRPVFVYWVYKDDYYSMNTIQTVV